MSAAARAWKSGAGRSPAFCFPEPKARQSPPAPPPMERRSCCFRFPAGNHGKDRPSLRYFAQDNMTAVGINSGGMGLMSNLLHHQLLHSLWCDHRMVRRIRARNWPFTSPDQTTDTAHSSFAQQSAASACHFGGSPRSSAARAWSIGSSAFTNQALR